MQPSPYADIARINTLAEIVGYKVEDLVLHFGIRVHKSGKKLSGCCPIHGGNRANAFNLYPDGHTARGTWKCRTKGCHNVFKSTVIGFARGMLSHLRYGYEGQTVSKDGKDEQGTLRVAPWKETIDYLCDWLGTPLAELKVDRVAIEKRRFATNMAIQGFAPQEEVVGWQPDSVRARLVIPSAYFLSRGYSAAVLSRYDVGDAKVTDPANPMFHRAVVPIYDDARLRVIGVSGRSLWPACQLCELHHNPADVCPSGGAARLARKWRHNEGFDAEWHLYNYWFARDNIARVKTIVLCEGPGDVWRLVEAGVDNAVALFGTNLTDRQRFLLEKTGALNLVLLLDNDDAGRKARSIIGEKLRFSFRIVDVVPSGHDVGGLTAAQVQTEVLPQIQGASRG